MPREYFNSLNYTIGNEDASLELAVMPENSRHVFAVAGSGSRVIPLLSKNPRYLTCADSSPDQLALVELRLASLEALDHKDYLSFWGYPSHIMTLNERQAVFEGLKMSSRARKITELLFKKYNWEPLLYAGKWERTFRKLSKINRWLVGNRGLGIFSCQTKKEQENYLGTKFPQKAWSLAIFILGNAVVFNALLYKGNFPRKNLPGSMHDFYLNRFGNLFKQDIARKNYFLQLLFFGTIRFPEGLPIECDPDVFWKAKNGLKKAKITYICNDVIKEAKRSSMLINFLSFSDVPSYLQPPREQEFLQEIKNGISPGGIIVNRYYLRIPENLNTGGYQDITDNFKGHISEEKIQMYSFGIYQRA